MPSVVFSKWRQHISKYSTLLLIVLAGYNRAQKIILALSKRKKKKKKLRKPNLFHITVVPETKTSVQITRFCKVSPSFNTCALFFFFLYPLKLLFLIIKSYEKKNNFGRDLFVCLFKGKGICTYSFIKPTCKYISLCILYSSGLLTLPYFRLY